jgi:hypothetical protein
MSEKADPVRVIGYRPQRTLAATAELEGAGFITGARVRVRFRPAPIDSGRVFRRVDQPLAAPIAARVECVTGTDRRTTLGPPAHGVTLVEHLRGGSPADPGNRQASDAVGHCCVWRARTDPQSPALCRRTGTPQGARHDRRPRTVWVRPRRTCRRVSFRPRTECRIGPATDGGGRESCVVPSRLRNVLALCGVVDHDDRLG